MEPTAGDGDAAGVGLDDAGDDLDERRLARPVLAEQGVDACGVDAYVDRPQHPRVAERLLDPDRVQRDQLSEGEGQSPSPSDPLRRGAPDGQQSLPVLRTEIPHSRSVWVTAYRRLTTPLPLRRLVTLSRLLGQHFARPSLRRRQPAQPAGWNSVTSNADSSSTISSSQSTKTLVGKPYSAS